MKKSHTAAAASRAIDHFSIDRSGDQAALAGSDEGWDDLNVLKNELSQTMLGFVIEIESITKSPELLALLGDKRGEFDQMLNVFYSDINRFSSTIETLRHQHEHYSGSIASMEQLNEFTRLSMSYQTLQIEMQSLLAPTMAGIILMMHEVAPTSIAVTSVPMIQQETQGVH